MNLPPILSGGEEIKSLRPWLNKLRDCVAAFRPIAGSRVSITQTPSGAVINAKTSSVLPGSSASSGSSPRPAVISSGSGIKYAVVYTDSTEGNGYAMPLQLNFFYTAPSGTAILVIPIEESTLGDGAGV
jgi:hypothetical protein